MTDTTEFYCRLAYRAALKKVSDLRDARDADSRTRLLQATQEIEAIVSAAHDADLTAANTEMETARRAWEDAKIAEAMATETYRVGLPMVKWATLRFINPPWKLTGLTGVIEVWTHDSARPGNRASVPDPGTRVVRILKRDGTPSTRFEPWNWFSEAPPYGWYPEGVDPNLKPETHAPKIEL